MNDILLPIVQTINAYLSDYILVVLLLGCGLYFSIRTKFVQVRCFGEGMKNVFGKLSLKGGKQGGGMSSFQALATAIAAQVGTGNIVGASGAILVGGPGAIFWMWIIAFLGMATIYAEAVLAQKTRVVKENGEVHGGPVYYIRTAFKGTLGKILAGFFAIAIILALGFFGCMVQSNSIGSTMETAFGIPSWIAGIALVVIAGFIFLGGMDRLASVTEKLVPVMATFYLLGGLIIFFANITKVPEAFGMIFRYAFEPQAIIGGGIGYALKTAISQGAKRGLFSNEAGMGSTPHAHAQANVKNPHQQGVVAMVGVFIDTFVVLTLNALVAADNVIIPMQCEYYALEGIADLMTTIRMCNKRLNPELTVQGIVMTMYDGRTKLSDQVVNEVREHFGPLAYDTIIQRNIRLGEAPSHGKPVMLYDAGAVGSENYLALAREFLKRNRKRSK